MNAYRLVLTVSKDTIQTLLPATGISGKTKEKVALVGLTFVKRLYYPCEIEALLSLNVEEGGAVPSLEDTRSRYSNIPAELQVVELKEQGEKSVAGKVIGTVAAGCRVVDVDVMYASSQEYARSFRVRLRICSPDCRLDTVRYSKAHTAVKLSEVVGSAVKTLCADDKLLRTNLRYLSYDSKGGGKGELLQPYIVQYNETFYDFARRVANRCGEYLYYEDGKLNLGLQQHDEKDTTVSKYVSATYHNHVRKKLDGVEYFHRNPLSPKPVTGSGSAGAYNMESVCEEYLDVISKAGYDSNGAEYDAKYCHLGSEIVSSFFTAPSLMQAALDLGVSQMKARLTAKNACESQTKKYEKAYFSDGAATCAQFSTHPDLNASNTKRNIDNALLSHVRRTQEELEDTMVDVSLGADIQCLGLGHVIKLDNVRYIVVEVSGSDTVNDIKGTREVRMDVRAVQCPAGSDPPVPPAIEEGHVRTSGLQTARIAKADLDPRRLGRVRIRYWWQPDGDDASPWIRVTTLNASAGGGTYFKPEEGDECLVDYENGNIERPYVLGYLNNSGRETRYGTREYSDILSNAGGQTIRMKDTRDDTNFWAGVFPVLSAVKAAFPGVNNGFGKFRKVSGFTEFTDEYGLYDFKMSSADRKISICSPFGNVVSNALTGISLSAPNGDIRITGKNVTIKAGNNVKLTSGTNISDKKQIRSDYLPTPGTVLNALLEKLESELLDFSLLRCLVETLIKPVAGNTTLKSNRFLLMEAGDGHATLPMDVYGGKYKKEWALVDDKDYQAARVLADLEPMVRDFKKLFKDRKDSVQQLKKDVKAYYETFGMFFVKKADSDYVSKWSLQELANNARVEENRPRYEKESWDTFKGKYEKDFKFAIDAEPSVGGLKESNLENFYELVNAINDDVVALKKPLEPQLGESEYQFIDKVKTAFDSVKDKYPSLEYKSGTDILEYCSTIRSWRMDKLVRRLIWAYLQQFTARGTGGLLQIVMPDNPDFNSDEGWNKSLESIKSVDGTQWNSILSSLVAKVKEVPGMAFSPAKDFFSWSSEATGGIIMSQKADKLIKFSGGDNCLQYEPSSSLASIVRKCIELGGSGNVRV